MSNYCCTALLFFFLARYSALALQVSGEKYGGCIQVAERRGFPSLMLSSTSVFHI